MPLVRICAGGAGQPASLPRPHGSHPNTVTLWHYLVEDCSRPIACLIDFISSSNWSIFGPIWLAYAAQLEFSTISRLFSLSILWCQKRSTPQPVTTPTTTSTHIKSRIVNRGFMAVPPAAGRGSVYRGGRVPGNGSAVEVVGRRSASLIEPHPLTVQWHMANGTDDALTLAAMVRTGPCWRSEPR